MKILFYLSLVLLSLQAYGQKNSPVVGNAAVLVDLLKKNYNALDPEIKQDEVIRDRSYVISLFKSYLTDEQKAKIDTNYSDKYKNQVAEAEEVFRAIKGKRKQLTSFIGSTSISVGSFGSTNPVFPIDTASKSLEIKLNKFYLLKNSIDSGELSRLITVYADSNLFISNNISLFKTKYKDVVSGLPDALAVSNYNSSLQKSIPFLGGSMGFETYIDGLARFMAQRIKDELSVYAIDNIKTWLDNPSANDPLAEFKVILPRTTKFIRSFSADRLTSFPNEIKQYIEDDLNHILSNAIYLKQTPRTARLIAAYPSLEFSFDALKIIPELSNIKYPIDYFKLLENSEVLKKWKSKPKYEWQSNLVNTIEMANMFAYSFIVMENDEPRFAGSSFLENYASETNFYQLYTGFLYQQNKKYYGISFKGDLKVKSDTGKVTRQLTDGLYAIVNNKMGNNAGKYKKTIQSILSETATRGEKVYTTALEIRQAKKIGKRIGADTVFNFINSIIDLSDQVLASGNLLAKDLMADVSLLDTVTLSSLKDAKAYLNMARSANDVIYDLQKKQYVTALTKSLQMAAQSFPSNNLSTIPLTLMRLSAIKPNENLKNWHTVFESVVNNENSTVKDINVKIVKSAQLLVEELSNIRYFYLVNYEKSNADTFKRNGQKLEMIENLLLSIKNVDAVTFRDAKAFLKEDFFKTLLISYYSNTAIDLAADAFAKEVADSEIGYVKVFRNFVPADFQKKITEYGKQIFINYVVDGNENDKALKNLRAELNQYVATVLQTLPHRTDVSIHPQVISMINFVNGMATAKDAEGVQKAIEAFALPTGSYSIKRKSQFNLSINSYPGVLPALEITWKNKVAYGALSLGFTAPVGLSFTWGRKEKESSKGFFLPIIDIGALTRLRLDDKSTTKSLPDFKFNNIFSPGVYFVHGFKKSPLTLYIGGQYGPDMKEVTSNEENIEISKSYESVRLGVGLVLDIPLLNLHTRSRL